MITLILLVLALVLFLVAGAGVVAGKWNLLSLGLAAWVAADVLAHSAIGH